jgi:hypothetical protein
MIIHHNSDILIKLVGALFDFMWKLFVQKSLFPFQGTLDLFWKTLHKFIALWLYQLLSPL